MKKLRCDGICKSFGGVDALKDLYLQFPVSGIVAIIGPNGAGKTTLINVLTGFLRPDAGRCYFGEYEITDLPPYRIAQLGIARTFQDIRLIFQVPILENIMLSRPRQRGETLLRALLRLGVSEEETRSRDEAKRMLSIIGLEENDGKLAGELSYGQQKLLTLACCIATGAGILFLDEPVAGVHPQLASHILNLLSHFREEGKLIVFIEHNISAVRQVADLVIVMDAGNVIAQGHPSEVLDSPEILEAYLA